MKPAFESKFFQKTNFSVKTITRYFNNALKDFKIALENKEMSVVAFRFAYDALIKLGITVIASCGYRVKSRRGHHVKILEKMSEILKDEDVKIIGNAINEEKLTGFLLKARVVDNLLTTFIF